MKRLVILVLIVVGLIGGAIAAAPFIAATDLAKRRIATQIEGWTGRPVTFSGEPKVKLFPFLSLTVEDARIGDVSVTSGEPLVAMDELTSKLRLLPFLFGRVDVAEFQFVRPHLRLEVDAAGKNNWALRQGPVVSEAAGERAFDAVDVPGQIAKTKLGRFKIVDGRITYNNAQNGLNENFNQVSAMLSWPEIAEPISGSGEMEWRGELVEFNGSIDDPLRLIASDKSAIRFAIASRPARASFTGTANNLADLQLDGDATVSTPSVRRVARWFGAEMEEGSILGAGLIEGKLNWIGPSFSFSDARVELDGNNAEGSLSIDLADQRPRIQGTLALENLDLTAYAEALQASIAVIGPWPVVPIKLPFLDIADADMRLSANQVLLGSARAGTSAASLSINDGQLAVSVSEAEFHGGILKANSHLEIENGTASVTASISLEDAEAGDVLAELAGKSFLNGNAKATLDASGRGATWGTLINDLAGTANLEISDGALIGIELGEFAGLSGGFGIADSATGTGTLPFELLAGSLTFAGGVVESEDLLAKGETYAIDLSGKVSLIDAGIEAIGVLAADKADAETEERKEIPFVIGGSWVTPYVLPDYEHLIRRGAENSRAAPSADSAPPATPPNG